MRIVRLLFILHLHDDGPSLTSLSLFFFIGRELPLGRFHGSGESLIFVSPTFGIINSHFYYNKQLLKTTFVFCLFYVPRTPQGIRVLRETATKTYPNLTSLGLRYIYLFPEYQFRIDASAAIVRTREGHINPYCPSLRADLRRTHQYDWQPIHLIQV